MARDESEDEDVKRVALEVKAAFERADLTSKLRMIKSQYCTYCHRETKQTLLHKNHNWVTRELPYKSSKTGITKSV